MYEYIKGIVVEIYPSYIVIEAGGIGYKILMANPFRITERNEEIVVYVYQNTSQENISLFGFKSLDEKQLFLKLINVSGIGPKSALAILANDDHIGLVNAIEREDAKYLEQFPGVGKKTAQQIVLDLKGKMGDLSATIVAQTDTQPITTNNQALDEAIEALKALGYSSRSIKRVEKDLKKLSYDQPDAYIREALKKLLNT